SWMISRTGKRSVILRCEPTGPREARPDDRLREPRRMSGPGPSSFETAALRPPQDDGDKLTVPLLISSSFIAPNGRQSLPLSSKNSPGNVNEFTLVPAGSCF